MAKDEFSDQLLLYIQTATANKASFLRRFDIDPGRNILYISFGVSHTDIVTTATLTLKQRKRASTAAVLYWCQGIMKAVAEKEIGEVD